MIKFRCPHCNQKMGVPDEYANRRIRCNKCNEPSRVPAATTVSSDAKQPQSALSPPGSQGQTKRASESFSNSTQQDVDDLQLKSPHKPKPTEIEASGFDELDMIEEAPNRQALQQLRKEQQEKRAAQTSADRKSKKKQRKARPDGGGRGFDLSELTSFVPDALRMPAGVAASVIAVSGMIGIWIVASRATASAMGFFALLVPLAGALALRQFAVEKTILWGIIAMLIGGLGIAAGKFAVTSKVVIPYFQNFVNEEVLVDLQATLANEQFQMPQGQSAKHIAEDGDFIRCIALISLVDDGLADPEDARKWILYRLLASNKTNVYSHLMGVLGSGPDAPPQPEIEPEDEAMLGLAGERVMQWTMEESRLRNARQYVPALNCIATQAEIYRKLQTPDSAYQFAFLSILGLFDVLWILLGLGLAYVAAVLD